LSARFLTAIRSPEAAKLAPLAGMLIGALAAGVYWLAAQIWPSNVAVIVSMTVTTLLTAIGRGAQPATRVALVGRLFCLLIKYNALMALSAAKLPFAVPANLALGLIMICGHAASFALVVSVMAVRPQKSAAKISGGDSALALLIGFAPAVLLGIPGLIGLAGAVIASLSVVAFLKVNHMAGSSDALDTTQQLTELSFYLGALASWRYI
jgi:adenosylcobinamide-GDP ribazoletransferase